MNIEQGEFRTVLGHFASGVVIVTGGEERRPTGFTCQSFFSLSLDPPLVAFAPGKSSTSWPRVAAGSERRPPAARRPGLGRLHHRNDPRRRRPPSRRGPRGGAGERHRPAV